MRNQIERSPELADLLNSHREAIAAAWAEMAHGLPDSHYRHVPLEQIRVWTTLGIAAFIESLRSGSPAALEDHLKNISLTRLQLGFEIGQVIEGLLLLREAARPFIRQARAPSSSEFEQASGQLDALLRYALHRFGNLCADLMQARIVEATQRRMAELESLQKVTTALLQKLTLSQVLEMVSREARQLTGAMQSAIFLLEDQDWLRAAHVDGEVVLLNERRPVVGTLLGQAVLSGEPVLINDVAHHAAETPYRDPMLETLLIIPLRVEGTIIGVLGVANKPGGFAQDEARILSLFADAAALAMESARLHQQAEQLAVLEERQRLARELHDSVTQALYSVTLYAEAARMALAAGQPTAALDNLRELYTMAREAMLDMRMLIFELHPPILEQEGLVSALRARLMAVENRAGLETEIVAEGERRVPLPLEQELYWIALEALTNVVKHARAQHVTITLQFDAERVRLQVQDDGQGFDLDQAQHGGGMGLRGITERVQRINGRLALTSAPGQGTRLQVEAIYQE